MSTKLYSDDFKNASSWIPITSGQAQLTLNSEFFQDSSWLRFDFDFHGGGGFVVARKAINLNLPASFIIQIKLRGCAQPNKLEIKLVDPSNKNVWRYQEDPCIFNDQERIVTIPSSRFDFAWGPAGGGQPEKLGAFEIALVAGAGGAGVLLISELMLFDQILTTKPQVTASVFFPGSEPEYVLDENLETSWSYCAESAWLQIDFAQPREYGGLILHWVATTTTRDLKILASDDNLNWQVVAQMKNAGGTRSFIPLPNGRSRWLKLEFTNHSSDFIQGLIALDIQPEFFTRSPHEFFHQVARYSPRGHYPRWLMREQTYWTPVNIPDGAVPALINEDGMCEPQRGGWSLEPLIWHAGRLFTWADVTLTQHTERAPIPSVLWSCENFSLSILICATGESDRVIFWIRYQVKNFTDTEQSLRLFVALRPFQVSPPWQAFGEIGGVSPIYRITSQAGMLLINDTGVIVPQRQPEIVGMFNFERGNLGELLITEVIPNKNQNENQIEDSTGYATVVLGFDLIIKPKQVEEIWFATPGTGIILNKNELAALKNSSGTDALAAARAQWLSRLGSVGFDLPAAAQIFADTCQHALAHILINRAGPALQPGPRRYTRTWIRDGAIMVAALLRLGEFTPVADFLRWYAQFQRADGAIPCCVDQNGIDWLAEHDSHGEFIFAVAEYIRFTKDYDFLQEFWPKVHKALGYLEQLRAQRLTPVEQTAERRACWGLLPESVSHEGYLAHPVHAYWDDLWALRGIKDAAWLAQLNKNFLEAERLNNLAAEFRENLKASIINVMNTHEIDFLPGSVEWADPDPTALAIALTLIDEEDALPAAAVKRTFERFLTHFRVLHQENSEPWTNYTPYEIRVIGALVRLGWRESAAELLKWYVASQRPTAWRQWPEIIWHDLRTPGHQGDLPHAWIGAEYILVFRDCLIYERERDESLIIAAGIIINWLELGVWNLTGLITYYGKINLKLQLLANNCLKINLQGELERLPPGGFYIISPFNQPLSNILMNGESYYDFTANEVHIKHIPAEILIQ